MGKTEDARIERLLDRLADPYLTDPQRERLVKQLGILQKAEKKK